MSRKHLSFLILSVSILVFAATVPAQPNIKIAGADSGDPIRTAVIEPGRTQVSIPLIVENVQGDQPIDVKLICEQPGVGGCRDIGGRVAGTDDRFSSVFKIPNIPPNGLVTLELKADMPINEEYDGVLLFTDGEGKVAATRLTFTRNFPLWADPVDNSKPTEQTLKVGRSGIAAVRIVANELAAVDAANTTLTWSEFFNEADSSGASVRFVLKDSDRKAPEISLKQVDLTSGVFTVKLDVSELQAGQIYRGQLVFDVVGGSSPPPLTLKLERLALGRKPVLIAEQVFSQVEAYGETVIDIQVREKEGTLPLEGLSFAWGKFIAGDGRQAPDIDLLTLTLHSNGEVNPLWSGSRSYHEDKKGSGTGDGQDNKAGDIPAHSQAILRISSRCPSELRFWEKPPWAPPRCLEPGKYRLPIELWSDNSDRTHDVKINVDFFVDRTRWVPILVLFAAIFIAYFMNRWRTNRIAADAVLNDIHRLLKSPALNLGRCALLPMVQTRADIKRVEAAMERERIGYRKLLMSPGVTEEMKARMAVINKRVPQIDRVGRLWEEWRQYDKPSVVHRVRKKVRKVAGTMSDQIRSDAEFGTDLDKSLEKIESLSDPEVLKAAYIEQVMTAVGKLLSSYDTSRYDDKNELLDMLGKLDFTELRETMANLNALKGRCTGSCQPPAHVIAVLEHWNNNGQQELDALEATSQELIALKESGVERFGKISTAFVKLKQELNKSIWQDLKKVDDLGELEALDEALSAGIIETIQSVGKVLKDLTQITETGKLPISDRDVVDTLRNELEHARTSLVESLDEAVRLDRSFYVPLKLIHDQTQRHNDTSKTKNICDLIRKRLSLTGGQSRQLELNDADVAALYEKVDGQVWKDLQGGDIKFDTPKADEIFHAYQMIGFHVSPITPKTPDVNAKVAGSYAFNHGFVYQWEMENEADLHSAPKRWIRSLRDSLRGPSIQIPQPPIPLTTREPMVQLYAPWEISRCKATVRIYPSEEQVGIAKPIEKDMTVVIAKSELRKRNARLRWYDGLNLILVFAAAVFAGIATDQFSAAMHGSYTALFTLFATGMALQQLRDWTFGNS